jgi:hypothetical protein
MESKLALQTVAVGVDDMKFSAKQHGKRKHLSLQSGNQTFDNVKNRISKAA